jgi:hypothetical protein
MAPRAGGEIHFWRCSGVFYPHHLAPMTSAFRGFSARAGHKTWPFYFCIQRSDRLKGCCTTRIHRMRPERWKWWGCGDLFRPLIWALGVNN